MIYNVLNEAYMGKTKNLLEVEKFLQVVVDKAKATTPGDGASYKSLNELKEVDMIEELLRKEFKFKKVILNFYDTRTIISMPNALTMPDAIKISTSDNLKSLIMNPIADRSKITANVNFGVELIRLFNLNAEEVLALILHELGHDDDYSLYYRLARQVVPMMNILSGNIGSVLALLPLGGTITEMMKNLNDSLSKVGWLNKLTNSIFKLGLSIDQITKFAGFLLIPMVNPITTIPAAVAKNLYITAIPEYKMEEYADSFSTKYGYGPALASGLHKIEADPDIKIVQKFDKLPNFMKVMNDISTTNLMIVLHMVDPHPQNITRMTNQLRIIEKELDNKDLNPKLRAELKHDYDNLKNFIEDEVINKEADSNKNRQMRAMYCAMVYRMTGGKTSFRDYIPAMTAMSKESTCLLEAINNYNI